MSTNSDRMPSGTDGAAAPATQALEKPALPTLSAEDLALVSDEGGEQHQHAEEGPTDTGGLGDDDGGHEAEDGDEAGAADDALSAEPGGAQADDDRSLDEVPEEASGYEPAAEREWTDADQPILDAFFEKALDLQLPKQAVAEITDWWADLRDKLFEADDNAAAAAEETLRESWGEGYDANLAHAKAWLKGRGDLGQAIKGARLPDGSRLGNNPAFVTLLADLARAQGVKPQDKSAAPTADPATAGEIAELEKLRTSDPELYRLGSWRGRDQTPAARAEELRPRSKRELELLEIMHADIGELHRRRNAAGETLMDELDRLRRGKRKSA